MKYIESSRYKVNKVSPDKVNTKDPTKEKQIFWKKTTKKS